MIPRTTLEQWAVLSAVVKYGSFSLAAEALYKSQSAVSYTIKTLQAQLPVGILVLKGRKAELTKAGEVLLRRSQQLLVEANSLEKVAKSLAQDWEAEITIVVDAIFPMEILHQAIEAFEPISDGCRIIIVETTLSATEEALLSGHANLVIATNLPPGYLGNILYPVNFIALSSPNHPLQQLSRELTEHDLKQHRQIVVKDGGIKRNQNVGWLNSEQRWTVSNFASSVAMLERGLGFAWIPQSFVATAIKAGTLTPLNLAVGQTRQINCKLVIPDIDSAGPATRKLAKIIEDLCQKERR